MRVFIASSNDLKEERKDLEILLHRKKYEPIVWENIDHSITQEKFQDKINNNHLTKSDIVIFMVKSKLGEFTQEEFKVAYENLGQNIKKMYVYFIDYDKNKMEKIERRKIDRLQEFLEEKGDLYQEVEDYVSLENHFLKQERSVNIESSSILKVEKKDTKSFQYIKRVAILSLSPINENTLYNLDDIFECFEKYNIELKYLTLNEENLDSLDDFESIFIFSKIINSNLMIENEYFESKLIDIDLVNETLLDYENINFHVFTSSDTDINKGNLCFDIIIVQQNIKEHLRKYLSKNYRKKFNKGKFDLDNNVTKIPYEFKIKNSLRYFVGRENDIRNIIRDIIELEKSKDIYTILGSGGIGKTTLVSKIVEELSKRRKFVDGFSFVDCEFMLNYSTFKEQMQFVFELNNVQDFEEELLLVKGTNKLIVLDNFETLLYLENSEDLNNIKELIEYIRDYAIIIITSREKVDEIYREPYPIDSLKLTDTLELFLNISKLKLKDEKEEKFLKDEILDNLLHKNPLAVKLAAGLRLNIYDLQKELSNNFFQTTDKDDVEFIETKFSNKGSRNIEKSKSLFYTIGLSYERLILKHKLVIELLSLFPDGLRKKDFISFYNENEQKNDINKIIYMDINDLEDKSMIIVNNEFIKLQSIIGQFAEYKFNKNDNIKKNIYYTKAYNYNCFILNSLDSNKTIKNSSVVNSFIKNKKNFLKSFDYITFITYDENILLYINDICCFLELNTSYDQKVFEKLNTLKDHFQGIPKCENLLDTSILRLKYFFGDFNHSFHEIQEKFPINSVLTVSLNERVNQAILLPILNIYEMEGNIYSTLKFRLENDMCTVWWFFLNIGEYKLSKKIYQLASFKAYRELFFDFELELNTKSLNTNDLEIYIQKLYTTQFIEKVQCSYTLLKANNNKVTIESIENLITINPFTDGLKLLMLAIKNNENCTKKMYEEAIKKLYHIKYYHVEAMYLYSKYLKDNNDSEYEKLFKKGKELSIKHYYRYLQHQFICLDSGVDTKYDEKNYPLPDPLDYSKIIKKYNLKGL